MDALRVGICFDIHKPWLSRALIGLSRFSETAGDWEFVRPPTCPVHAALKPAYHIDAMIYDGPGTGYEYLLDRNIPAVQLGWYRRENVPRVTTDTAAMGELAARYFIERGFRQLVVLLDANKEKIHNHVRTAKFLKTGRDAGCQVHAYARPRRLTPSEHWTLSLQIREFGELVQSLPGPVGVFGADIEHGWRALIACREAGLRIPEDAAVLSAGEDELLFEATQPQLSGIAQDTEQLGYRAGEILHKLMQGQSVPELTLIAPIGIITRSSTDIYCYEDEILAQALSYIRQHLAEDISTAALSDYCKVSESTLHRRFQSALGRSPGAEIRRARINEAKRLLRTTNIPLLEIALRSGLNSQPQLNRAIREETGLTPAQYRKQHGL